MEEKCPGGSEEPRLSRLLLEPGSVFQSLQKSKLQENWNTALVWNVAIIVVCCTFTDMCVCVRVDMHLEWRTNMSVTMILQVDWNVCSLCSPTPPSFTSKNFFSVVMDSN